MCQEPSNPNLSDHQVSVESGDLFQGTFELLDLQNRYNGSKSDCQAPFNADADETGAMAMSVLDRQEQNHDVEPCT